MAPKLFETNRVGVGDTLQIAVGAGGAAVAVWAQPMNAGGRTITWASGYQPGLGWTPPAAIVIDDGITESRAPRVAIDPVGQSVAVWRNGDGSLWSARATPPSTGAMTWSAPVRLSTSAQVAPDYALAMSPAGNAVLAWIDYRAAVGDLPATRDLWVAEGNGASWSSRLNIESSDGDASRPVVAIGAGGAAAIAWEQRSDSGAPQVFAARWLGPSSWSAPQLLTVAGGSTTLTSFEPRLAVDASGRMLAVWRQSDGGLNQLWSSAAPAAGPFAAGRALTAPIFAANLNEPSLAMNDAGQAVLGWGDIAVQFYNADTGQWAASERRAATDPLAPTLPPRVAIGPSGQATVAWVSGPGTNAQVVARSADASGAWLGDPQRIDSPSDGGSYQPQLGTDGSNHVLAVWLQITQGIVRLWAGGTR